MQNRSVFSRPATFFVLIVCTAKIASAQLECGDCLVANPTPSCSIQEVADCVCQFDAFCCTTSWTLFCVNEVTTFNCLQFCVPATPAPTPAPTAAQLTKGSLSGGWIFTIVVLVLFFAYCVVGNVWKRFTEGVVGFEAVPHIDFWRTLPRLVQDGCIFVLNRCKKDGSYGVVGNPQPRAAYT